MHKLKHDYAVTAVCFSATGNEIYAGGIDNVIHVKRHPAVRPCRRSYTNVIETLTARLRTRDPQVWDLRRQAVGLTLQGHADTITSLRRSPEGGHLLSNSMDNTGTATLTTQSTRLSVFH